MASLLRIETVSYGDATVTVQGETLLTGLRRNELNKRLTDVITFGVEYLGAYLMVVAQTLSAEGLPFALPTYADSDEAHKDAFEQFLNLPSGLQAPWCEACVTASLPPGKQIGDVEVDQKDPKANANTPSA